MKTVTITLVVICSLVALAVRVHAFEFTNCIGDQQPLANVTQVRVSTCNPESDQYCVLIRGKDAEIEVDFTTLNTVDSAKLKVFGKLSVVSIPFPVLPDQACGNYGFECPIPAGTSKTFALSLPVLKVYPKISLKVRLSLENSEQVPLFCVEFPARIVDATR